MKERKNVSYQGQEVAIADEPAKRILYGPGLQINDCRVNICSDANGVGLINVVMKNCVIVASQSVKSIKFTGTRFENCQFIGEFDGCDFGHNTVPFDYGGALVNCDFSAAMLHDCRIFDSELKDLRLRTDWPQIVLVDNFADIAKGRLRSASTVGEKVLYTVLANRAPAEVAVLKWAPKMAQDLEMSEEQLVLALAGMPILVSQ